MAPLLEDPRIRQTWNQISHNAETATESAAEGLWTFTHAYINPCLSSISTSVQSCTGRCFPDRDERARRTRERTRGRAEFSFDFYDDWDDEFGGNSGGGGGSHSGLLGWGNSEWDRLLAGSGAHGTDDRQPGRKRGMSYGTRSRGPRRKSTVEAVDPTVIPSSNALGFLGRLPFKLGGTLRYKPSAANLQDHPGALRADFDFPDEEREPLIEDDDDNNHAGHARGHTRQRSSTTSSGETTDSFRSRGDLFPSDGEDDAVPLDDEFAMALERRATNQIIPDDRSSAKTRASKGKKRATSSLFSRNTRSSSQTHVRAEFTPEPESPAGNSDMVEVPSLLDLHHEEERIRKEEDHELQRKREAAFKLAVERGLNTPDPQSPVTTSKAHHDTDMLPGNTDDKQMSAGEQTDAPPPPQEPTKDLASSETKEFVPARLPFF